LQNPEIIENEKNLEIKIIPDPSTHTLTVWDTGIGMNKEDLINNLGTIARSGTTQFLEAMKNADSMNQIGQFGVGFYSYFLVAANITVISRKAGENEQWIWSSDAGSGFKIMKDTSDDLIPRGTKIILKLKDDMKEYLDQSKIKELIKKYSNYIGFGIFMEEEKTFSEEVPMSEEELRE
jgi:HSP90 family molecular chaperone